MKLYWRYKKDGKWNWKAARYCEHPDPEGTGFSYRVYTSDSLMIQELED